MRFAELLTRNLWKLLSVLLCTVLLISASGFLFSRNMLDQAFQETTATLDVSQRVISLNFQYLIFILTSTQESFSERLSDVSADGAAAQATQAAIRDYSRNLTKRYREAAIAGAMPPPMLYAHIADLDIFPDMPDGPPGNDLSKNDWYRLAVAKPGTVVQTPPFTRGDSVFIYIAKAVMGRHGEIFGAVCLEIDLARMVRFVSGLNYRRGGYGVMMTEDMTVIAYKNNRFIGRHLSEMGPDHHNLVKMLKQTPVMSAPMHFYNSEGVDSVFFFKKMSNGWYIGTSLPARNYMRDVFEMIAVLAGMALLIFLASAYFILRLSQEQNKADMGSQSKSLFLARMSHEIRTPLNSIIGLTELISRMDVPQTISNYMEIITQSGKSLLALVSDILDFSRIESGAFGLSQHPYQISSLINDVVNMARLRLQDKEISLIVHVSPQIPMTLIGDAPRVRQIFYNLVTNAIKYTEKGFIHLNVGLARFRNDNSIVLSFFVKDTGMGIAPEEATAIFENFRRSEARQHSNIEGTGLGLAITQNLCTLMDGHIEVTSQLGKGSRFSGAICQGFTDRTPLAEIKAKLKPRLLLFHDNPLELVSLYWAIRDLGLAKPYTASDMQDFLQALQRNCHDVALVSSRHIWRCPVAEMPNVRFIGLSNFYDASEATNVPTLVMPGFSIPLANILNHGNANTRETRSDANHFSIPSAKFLVVDDTKANLMVAKAVLASFGAQVDTCEDGRQALNFACTRRYDIIFMDHMMPGMDGIETTAAIRKAGETNENCKDVIIVALTANAVSGQREFFLRSGFDEFIAKPIEMHKLAEIIRHWVPETRRLPVKSRDKTNSLPDNFAVEGLDCAAGLANAGNNLVLYKDILTEYRLSGRGKIVRMQQALRDNDLKTYTVLVHGAKSASRVIGANKAASIAAYCEEAAIAGDIAFLEDTTPVLVDILEKIFAGIEKALPNEAPETLAMPDNADAEIEALDLGVLKNALLAMDIHTVNSVLQHYTSLELTSWQKACLAGIEQAILSFEYAEAIGKIDAALGRKAPPQDAAPEH